MRVSLEALGSIPQLALLTEAPHCGNCISKQLCTYTYLFFKHKAKVSKHITNRGSSLKLLAGVNWLEESHSAVKANFSLNHQQNLVHVALVEFWVSPLFHMTQSHESQRHIWPSKKPLHTTHLNRQNWQFRKKIINCRNIIMGYKSILSILKSWFGRKPAQERGNFLIKFLRLSYQTYSMSSTWKTGSSVSLEKSDWNIAIQQDWNYLLSANKYSCKNLDISPKNPKENPRQTFCYFHQQTFWHSSWGQELTFSWVKHSQFRAAK